jgi:hypothetical protein
MSRWGAKEKTQVLEALLAAGFERDVPMFRRRGFPAVLQGDILVSFREYREFDITRLETSPDANPRRWVPITHVYGSTGRGWVGVTVRQILDRIAAYRAPSRVFSSEPRQDHGVSSR